jgi:hypothetical protein
MKCLSRQTVLACAIVGLLWMPAISGAQEGISSDVPDEVVPDVATTTMNNATSTPAATSSPAFVVATTTPDNATPRWRVAKLQEVIENASSSTIADADAQTELLDAASAIEQLLERADTIRSSVASASFGIWYSFRANFFEHLAVSRLDRLIGRIAIFQERGVIERAAGQSMIAWVQEAIAVIHAR